MSNFSQTIYPFSAIVGQVAMKRALVLAAIHPGLGGVLVRGTKGAAKSTAVRALAAILPEIDVYPGDPFRRAPGEDVTGWPLDPAARKTGSPVALVNLPVGATEDRVVGSLNMERALATGARVFEPGLLASAHRGILYIDEVNLLGDHLVDLLLDAAAMGVNHVEREGLAFQHPARFLLVGTMNPEEGELRPQLLDRFGLAVDAEPMNDPRERVEVVRRRLAFEADPARFRADWQEADRREGEAIVAARRRLPSVTVPDTLLEAVSVRCAREGAEGLRADLTIVKAASALAAYEGRVTVTHADVEAVAELALAHRRTMPQPTTPPPSPPPPPPPPEPGREPSDQDPSDAKKQYYAERESRAGLHASADPVAVGERDPAQEEVSPAEPFMLARSRVHPPSRRSARGRGRRGPNVPVGGARGATVGATAVDGKCTDPALVATVRAASPWQNDRGRGEGDRLILRPIDLRRKVRKLPTRHLVVFVVDASRSMGARRRMAETKAAVLSLLVDAYQNRDLVGLVTFGGVDARVALPPTPSVRRAARSLSELPIGGLTPLARGLATAGRVVATARRRDRGVRPLIVLLTDGRCNVPLEPGGDPLFDALAVVKTLATSGVAGLVIDTESGPVRLGGSRKLAEAWDCDVDSLDALSGKRLPEAIRRAVLAG